MTWALEAANPAFDVSQASLAQRFKVPRFRLRLAHASPLPWCGGSARVLNDWQEEGSSFQSGPVERAWSRKPLRSGMLVLGAPICLCFCDRLSVCARGWSGIDDLPGGRVNVCPSVSRRRRQFMQTPCPYPIQEHPWLTDSSPKLLKLSIRPRHRPQPPLTGTRHTRYFAPPEYVKFPLWTVSLSLTAWLPPTPTATPAPPSALPCPVLSCPATVPVSMHGSMCVCIYACLPVGDAVP